MIFNRKLLQFMEFVVSPKKEREVVVELDDTSQLIEEEIQQDVAHMSTLHCDSEEFKKASESVKNLCEADAAVIKASAEREKVRLQVEEAKKRRAIDWGALIPKLVAIGAYAFVTFAMICLERQTPLSMRWLRAADSLLAPKGI